MDMYQKFKRHLLEEMEMRRDMIVLNMAQPSLEPIFEVSSTDDKLYRRILTEFDFIAIRSVEKLIYDLCVRDNIPVQMSADSKDFDIIIDIDGVPSSVEFKSSPTAFNSSSYQSFILRVKEATRPVFLVYLLKDSPESRNTVYNRNCRMINKAASIGVELNITLLEDFMLKLFGSEEVKLFKKAMLTYKEEMHQAVGYQITEIFNYHNLAILKEELQNEFKTFDYNAIKQLRYAKIHLTKPAFGDLNSTNYNVIKNRFINQERYKLLLGNSDFAKSFLTSEWLYKKYFSLAELDNTFIVAGYLKSIEQMLWDIIYILGQGRAIGRDAITIEKDNVSDIDTTLGSLQFFIANYSNEDLFESAFGYGKGYVRNYLKVQLNDWRDEYRNGFFHKDNLNDKSKIDTIREETYFLYFLILGSISLDDETIVLLGQ